MSPDYDHDTLVIIRFQILFYLLAVMFMCSSEQGHFDQASAILDSENRVGLGLSDRKCIAQNLVPSFQLFKFCHFKLAMNDKNNSNNDIIECLVSNSACTVGYCIS